MTKTMRSIRMLLLALMAIGACSILSGCETMGKTPTCELEPSEKAYLERKANAGDRDAAYRLMQSTTYADQKEHKHWKKVVEEMDKQKK